MTTISPVNCNSGFHSYFHCKPTLTPPVLPQDEKSLTPNSILGVEILRNIRAINPSLRCLSMRQRKIARERVLLLIRRALDNLGFDESISTTAWKQSNYVIGRLRCYLGSTVDDVKKMLLFLATNGKSESKPARRADISIPCYKARRSSYSEGQAHGKSHTDS